MANVFQQGNFQGFSQSASARTLQFTTQNTTAGSMLWAAIATESSAGHTTVTVSDDQNGSWTQAGSGVYGQQSTTRDISIWYFTNSKGGVKPTVTVTPSQSVFIGLCIGEHTTTSTSVSVDHTATGNSTGQNITTGTVTVSQSGTLVIAACGSGDNNNSTITANSPFTMRESQINGSSFEQCSAATDESASANEACTFGFTASHSVMNIIASFNVGSSGNTYNVTASGGILCGSSATVLKTSTIAASGGTVNGGNSTIQFVGTVTAAGGTAAGGSASIVDTDILRASGGSVLGGSAVVYLVTNKTSSGGTAIGSTAIVQIVVNVMAAGGSVAGATSTISLIATLQGLLEVVTIEPVLSVAVTVEPVLCVTVTIQPVESLCVTI